MHQVNSLVDDKGHAAVSDRCKLMIQRKVGLDVVRDALGLREDVNHFELVDANELLSRKTQRRQGIINFHERYSYQVAIASMSDYSIQAQKFAATHRIPLIEFDKMGVWADFRSVLHDISCINEFPHFIGIFKIRGKCSPAFASRGCGQKAGLS